MAFPSMKNSPTLVAHIADLLAGLDGVAIRPMFGGHGLFREGLMFGCLAADVLYVRADGERAARLKGEGSSGFTFETRGREMTMPYWTVPDSAMDDADALVAMCRDAFGDAVAADQAKPKGKRKHTGPAG